MSQSQAAPGPPASGSYIGRHWRGENSLPYAFWVNGTVIFIVMGALTFGAALTMLGIAMTVLGAQLSGGWIMSAAGLQRLGLGFLVGIYGWWGLCAAVQAWQLVGIWRSALRALRQSQGVFWPLLAMLFVALTFLVLALAAVGWATSDFERFPNTFDQDLEGTHT